ncbi:MAG: tRNA lysidine(34) synthetase TilS [Spirulinaceae cyanobacterium SM2_1_0]|nr:tRNA lysidine(34) synthetase TilS [Spirulinaceae cyanobacterium SM2_1_0]
MAAAWTPLHARLHTTLRQRSLLPPGTTLLIAVSGGQDSLCLLRLLLDLQPKWRWQLAVGHCDHGWAIDVGLAARLAAMIDTWQLPFYLARSPTPLPETEAAARQWRYTALSDLAQQAGATRVVTAHTLSDRAETLLYNLIRGAGADGLQALAWERSLAPGLTLVRPLLEVARIETGTFCQQQALPIQIDPANSQLRYARNRLRQQVLPLLRAEFNPQVEVALAQTAELLTAEVDYLKAQAITLLQASLAADGCGLHRPTLRQAPLALQRRALRQFWQQQLAIAPSFQHLEALTQLLDAPNRSRTHSLPTGAWLEVEGDWLRWHAGT